MEALPPNWRIERGASGPVLYRPDGLAMAFAFDNSKAARRGAEAGALKQGLPRALGLTALNKRLGRMPAILDATAGLGQESWLLATLGCEVTALERHPALVMLLNEALQNADPTVASRLSFRQADSVSWLGDQAEASLELIYIDPMFPEHGRRANVQKGLQMLQALHGEPEDPTPLLQAALRAAIHRVVIKRPQPAPPLEPPGDWTGQQITRRFGNTRFDVYLPLR